MKIKFYLDEELPPNKTIEIPSMMILVSAIFLENNKYYPRVFFINVCINYRRERNKNSYNKF